MTYDSRWPQLAPHAKFYDAQYIAMSPLVSAVGLRILFQREGDARAQLRQAAALASASTFGRSAGPSPDLRRLRPDGETARSHRSGVYGVSIAAGFPDVYGPEGLRPRTGVRGHKRNR